MKKHYTFLFLLFAFLFCRISVSKAQVDVNDSLALVDLYDSTDGPHWTYKDNWLTKAPLSTWYGISVDDERVNPRVIRIILQGNNMKNSIPASLGNLTQLYGIELPDNQLSGSIPPSLGNLANLGTLYLNNNQLSGSIPASFGNLPNLTGLDLHNNQLSGSIPSSLGNLKYLYYLDLSSNQLSGSIPPSLGKIIVNYLNGLKYLYLNNNQLSGNIPPSLGKLTDLVFLYLNDNQLGGDIPSELGNLANLSYLRLNNNQLIGAIPSSFGNIKNLLTLDLSHNKLRDSIPSGLANCTKLNALRLSYNRLTGNIPSSFSNLKGLRILGVGFNDLGGSASVFTTLPRLRKLRLVHNHYTFDGMEDLVQHPFDTLRYRDQKKIPVHQNGNKLSVYAGGTLSNNTYKWYRNGALAATITGDSTFTPSRTGAYNVEVTNSIATELTLKSDTITLSGLTSIAQNNVSSALGTGKNNFSLYPNPAKTTVTVSFATTGNSTIKLTDVSGKVLQSRTVTAIKEGNIIQLDISKYPAGTYFVSVSDERHQTQTLKMIKEQ